MIHAGLIYGNAPNCGRHREHRIALADKSMLTTPGIGVPVDAQNVALEGGRENVFRAMRATGLRRARRSRLREAFGRR
jgi:hypothetical protein